MLPKALQKKTKKQKNAHLGCWINGEFQFRLLAIINRKAFHQQRGETAASAAAE